MTESGIYEHYEVVRRADGTFDELGRGAMGITFRALDTRLRRAVALKVVKNSSLNSQTAKARFIREAREAARLRHPGVVEVFHFGETEEGCFYAMELVEGESLQERVKRKGALDAFTVLSIGDQVAQALAAAEVLSLIHRDIKPSNIMLSDGPEGEIRVKLIDFGLAKQAACADKSTSGPVTVSGFVGTPMFASPEQLEERELDTRSDIYSLGVTLWYAMTGKFPFEGSTASVISQHLTEMPPRTDLAGYPRPIQDILLQMLEKDPDDRPQRATDLRRAILRCREQLALSTATSLGTTKAADAFSKALSLRHPNLVRVLRVEGKGAKQVIETETLNGFSLLDWVRVRRKLPYREIAPLLEQLASVIDFAMEHGLETMDLRIGRIWVHFPESGIEEEASALIRWPTDKWPSFKVKVRGLVNLQKTEAPGTCFATIVPEDQNAWGSDPESGQQTQDYLFQMAALIYELLAGHPPPASPGAEYKVLAALDEIGNQTIEQILKRASPISTALGLCATLRESGRETARPAPVNQPPPELATPPAERDDPSQDAHWMPTRVEVIVIALSGLAIFAAAVTAAVLLFFF